MHTQLPNGQNEQGTATRGVQGRRGAGPNVWSALVAGGALALAAIATACGSSEAPPARSAVGAPAHWESAATPLEVTGQDERRQLDARRVDGGAADGGNDASGLSPDDDEGKGVTDRFLWETPTDAVKADADAASATSVLEAAAQTPNQPSTPAASPTPATKKPTDTSSGNLDPYAE